MIGGKSRTATCLQLFKKVPRFFSAGILGAFFEECTVSLASLLKMPMWLLGAAQPVSKLTSGRPHHGHG
jgi:hypothetical protein